jgi:hypothetical protein
MHCSGSSHNIVYIEGLNRKSSHKVMGTDRATTNPIAGSTYPNHDSANSTSAITIVAAQENAQGMMILTPNSTERMVTIEMATGSVLFGRFRANL